MNVVIDKLVEVLSSSHEIRVAERRLGSRRPSDAGETPAITMFLSLDNTKGAGIGRFIRAGDSIVKSTSVQEVQLDPTGLSDVLSLLRLSPLPLRRSPSSTKPGFSGSDVQITNVTDLAHPVEYSMLDRPVLQQEYRLDVARAEIRFGQPQTPGDKLEVVHWTVSWRDEILGDRYGGSVFMEIWAQGADQADETSRTVQRLLGSNRTMLREKGFLKLDPLRLGPLENLLHDPPVGSPFSVWKQSLAYRFTFEGEVGGELSQGVPIKQIELDVVDGIQESFSVP